jgi:chromatin structure-remodeling complex subunit RSC1/2
LYVCDSRYNDRERVFVKIKNWNSCVPEEVRKSTEFMPIYPFERMVFPRRVGSPFLPKTGKGTAAVKGPGGIEETVETVETEKAEAGGGTARKRPKRTTTGANAAHDQAGPSKGPHVGASGTNAAVSASAYHYQYQPPHVSQPPSQPHHRSHASNRDRSIIGAAGGLANVGNNVLIEKLPAETGKSACIFVFPPHLSSPAKHFDRDPETNEVLWFSAPPMNIARPPVPKHSLTYLHFLATKRKRGKDMPDDGMDVDDDSFGSVPSGSKREKVPPTVTETVNAILADLAQEH